MRRKGEIGTVCKQEAEMQIKESKAEKYERLILGFGLDERGRIGGGHKRME